MMFLVRSSRETLLALDLYVGIQRPTGITENTIFLLFLEQHPFLPGRSQPCGVEQASLQRQQWQ
jgi:hypothetical protein